MILRYNCNACSVHILYGRGLHNLLEVWKVPSTELVSCCYRYTSVEYFLLTEVPMKKRRRGGLDHVLSPELGLLHQLCHQANHPHTKILCIQIVSLLWRAGNPARNAPGNTISYSNTVMLMTLDCECVFWHNLDGKKLCVQIHVCAYWK